MNFEKLIAIANASKNASLRGDGEGEGDYVLPNVIFAYLIEAAIRQRRLPVEERDLVIAIESDDEEGSCIQEAYYDLVVVRARNHEELCLPLPILDQKTISTILKGEVEIYERGEHSRDRRVPIEGETLDLWRQFLAEVGDTAVQAAKFAENSLRGDFAAEVPQALR